MRIKTTFGPLVLVLSFILSSCSESEIGPGPEPEAMAEAGVTAVVLPGAFYFLGGGQAPPIDAFRRRAVPIAIARFALRPSGSGTSQSDLTRAMPA